MHLTYLAPLIEMVLFALNIIQHAFYAAKFPLCSSTCLILQS